MRTAFRVDASTEIGTGHVIRCLTLADKLRRKGILSDFICQDLEGNFVNYIQEKGYSVWRIPPLLPFDTKEDTKETIKIIRDKKLDWIILDSYHLSYEWEQKVAKHAKKIMVLDDLANRKHLCDILLDQNYYKNKEIRYDGLLKAETTKLLGPSFALIRDEFLRVRDLPKEKRDYTRILVSFGGSDTHDITSRILVWLLEAIEENGGSTLVNVIIGGSNPRKEIIQKFCEKYDALQYYCQVDNMADQMHNADLYVGAGGSTTWERYCVGLPGIVITTADNQVELTTNLQELGIDAYLGHYDEVSKKSFKEALSSIRQGECVRMKAQRIVDGAGAARVVEKLLNNY